MAGTVTVDTIQSGLSTPTVFKNTSGTEIGQLSRLWVNFAPGASPSIRASFNVSSISRVGTGIHTVNITNTLADANYSSIASGSGTTGQAGCLIGMHTTSGGNAATPTSSAYTVASLVSGSFTDVSYVLSSVFR